MRVRASAGLPRRGLVLALAASFSLPAAGAERAVRTFVVGDGTAGVLVEDHRVPVAWVVVDLPVGTAASWARGLPLEEAWRIQLDDPADRFRRRADRLAADISLVVGARSCSLRAACLADDLPAVVALVRDVLANRSIDGDELRRWRRERRIAWDASMKEPWFLLDRATAKLLFRAGDARRDGWEEPADVVVDRDRLLAVRDTVLAAPGRVVGFAGAVTLARAEALSAGLLPDAAKAAPGALEPRLRPPVPLAERAAAVTVTVPRMRQVLFALARVAPEVGDPDYPAFLVADHVLGGHFYSRLNVALRHRGGDTYGASTRHGDGTERRAYALTTFTESGNAAAAEAKLRSVLEAFHRGGITEEERRAAAGFLTGRIAFAHQSPEQDLLRLLHERSHGLPPGTLDAAAGTAAAVPLERVNAFIGDFYDPSRFRLVTVTPVR